MSKIKTAFFLLPVVLLLMTGCHSLSVEVQPYRKGKILILPPRDVVQDGRFHEKGQGSGELFQEAFKHACADSGFEVITTDNPQFNNEEIADLAAAKAEAAKLNADFYLQVVLGEFLNAAPFTFRPDFVFLDKAAMYDTKTGAPVWQVTKRYYLEKSNMGNHLGLIKKDAHVVAASIKKNAGSSQE